MAFSSTLLYNGMIVTMDTETRVFRNGAILIQGDIIMEIGQSSQLFELYKDDSTVELIDLVGKFIIPGLINAHVHTSLQLGRGMANDIELVTFINNRLFPFEAQMTEEDSYLSTMACGAELIRSGVTTFAEAGGRHVPGMARAVADLGMRGCLTQSNFDAQTIPGVTIPPQLLNTTDECINSQIELHHTYNGTADGRIRIWLGIRQVMGSTEELLTRTRDTAKELNIGVHMHVGEISFENQFIRDTKGVDGGTSTYINRLQLLDTNFLAAVSVWVSEPEIQLLANAKACVVHCPSNSMHSFGFAPVKEMLDAGVTVTLGTDGPSNNRVSMVDEMYMAALINKGRPALTAQATDPSILPAETVLRMVTTDGAKALLWDNEIGSLEVGKKADLVLVNPNNWAMIPVIDSIASLVYSMRTENIESVMCNGRWIMRDKSMLTVTDDQLFLASQASSSILERAGITIPTRMNFV